MRSPARKNVLIGKIILSVMMIGVFMISYGFWMIAIYGTFEIFSGGCLVFVTPIMLLQLLCARGVIK